VKTESGNCVDEYGYDWMGNVIRHKRTIKGLDGKKTEYNASYSYDYFGRMKTMKLPDGEIVTYGYNKGGQLSGVGSSKGKPYVSGIKYNVTGQRTQINYGNGTGTSCEYDERNHRLKRLETRNAKSILQTIEYEYDDTGNVTERESEMLGTDGRMKHAVHEYEYDSSGRLTEGSGKVEKTTAGILRPNIVSYKSKYSYDAIGNILTKTQAVNGGESSLSCNDTYTYGGKQPHAVTKAGAMVFTYDDNGNMIKRENTETKNTMTLVWDDENRLIKTTDSLHTTDYRYDANGERIIKKSELGETQYVSANYIVRNKTVISKHIFAGNQRVASTVSMKDNCGTVSEKNTMYFHPDHLGSSSYVTDKKGNFFEMIEYLPYGETLYDEAATVDKTEFRFTSKEQDAETGLYYHGARYRDAKTGVWLSCDPILESYLPTGNKENDKKLPAGGVFNPVNLNMYHYAGNNPVRFIDPDGNVDKDAIIKEIKEFERNADYVKVTDKPAGKFANWNSTSCYTEKRLKAKIYTSEDKSTWRQMDAVFKYDKNNDSWLLTDVRYADYRSDSTGTRDVGGWSGANFEAGISADFRVLVGWRKGGDGKGGDPSYYEEYDLISGKGTGSYVKERSSNFYKHTPKTAHGSSVRLIDAMREQRNGDKDFHEDHDPFYTLKSKIQNLRD